MKDAAFKAGFIASLTGEFRAVPAMFGFTADERARFYKGYDAATDLDTAEHVAAAQKFFKLGTV